MMNKALRSAWREFQDMISQIHNQDNQITIFKCIQGWYFENKKLLSPRLIEESRIEELINIDTKNYPLEKSQYTPEDIKRFLKLQPSSEECTIMWLRNQLWKLIVLSVDIECENCGKLDMSALFNIETENIFFECTQCGWIKTNSGYPEKSIKTIRLAINKDLKIAGLI
ncbi:MAG: hypothetical protein KI793_12355 [Rivularia sp. (in: Bacteria)]|nr:hypothetical protein [Rivularia sp. MS3]